MSGAEFEWSRTPRIRSSLELLLGRLGGGLLAANRALFGLGFAAGCLRGRVTLLEPDRFAGAAAEIVELGAPNFARALHHDVGHAGRVQRKDPFHALALDDPAHDEHFPRVGARASDHHAVE